MKGRRRLVFGLVCVLCCLVAAEAQAATYYVRPSGNDSAAGTSQATAWRTLSRVSSADLNPGDSVLLQGGATFSGQLRFGPEDSGTAASPVTVNSFGTGRATIQAGDLTGLQVRNAPGFAIRNINLQGSSRTTNTGNGIHFLNDLPGATKLSYARISNVDVSRFGNAGILIEGAATDSSKSGWQDVEVTNCVLNDNEYHGMLVQGVFSTAKTYSNKNVRVRRCRVFNNPGDPTFTDSHSGNGIVLSDVNGGLIERTIAYNNGYLCASTGGGPVGLWTWHSNNITLQYNESYSNRKGTAPIDGGGLDLDGGVTNTTVQYNYTHDNDGDGILLGNYSWAGYQTSGNVVRYNLSVNDARADHAAGIFVYAEGTGVSTTDVYNNTVFLSPASGATPSAVGVEKFGTAPLGVRLWSNQFITTGGVALIDARQAASDIVFQGNNYWSSGGAFRIKWGASTYPDLSTWRTATGKERLNGGDVGFSLDPKLLHPASEPTIGDPDELTTLDAYRIRSDSPTRDVALDLPALFGVAVGPSDYFGASIPQYGAFDVGGHEFANPVANDGFETGTEAPWTPAGPATVVSENPQRGGFAAKLTGQASFTQTVTGLAPNTAYTVSAQLKQDSLADGVSVGVKDYGGVEKSALGNSLAYVRRAVTFTTGPTNTAATIYLAKNAGAGSGHADEVAIERVPNLASNPGWESGGSDSWTTAGTAGVLRVTPHTGIYAARMLGSGGAFNQTITGLTPNTTYTLSGWLRQQASGDSTYLGVNDFGGTEKKVLGGATTYARRRLTFKTGASSASANIFVRKEAGTGAAYADDLVLVKGS